MSTNRPLWERLPVTGPIGRALRKRREREAIITALQKAVIVYDSRSVAERIAAMDATVVAYLHSLDFDDTTIIELDLDQIPILIPAHFQPSLTTEQVMADITSAIDKTLARETIVAEPPPAAEHGLASTEQPEPEEPWLTPFTLADLGLSDEEIAALDEGWPPAPRVAQQLSDADLARLQNMDSAQLMAAHELDLSDREILELGLDRLYPLRPQTYTDDGLMSVFSLADLGLTFSEIVGLDYTSEAPSDEALRSAITSGVLDRQALDYIRRHPEIVPPETVAEEPELTRWLEQLVVDENVIIWHPRFREWLLTLPGTSGHDRDSVTGLLTTLQLPTPEAILRYLIRLDEVRATDLPGAYYLEIELGGVKTAAEVFIEWADRLTKEADRLLALCEAAYQIEAGTEDRREVYGIFGAEYSSPCICGARLELLGIARQIVAAAEDDRRYAAGILAAATKQREADEEMRRYHIIYRENGAPVMKRYRFFLAGAYDLSVFVNAQNPQYAVSNLRDEKVVNGETPQEKRRQRQRGEGGWCSFGYDAFMEALALVSPDSPIYSEQYSSTLVMRDLSQHEGPGGVYEFSITGFGETFSCRISAPSFYAALDQILTGQKQMSQRADGLRAGGLFDVFNFNTEPQVLAKLATLTPENRMAYKEGYRIRWQSV